MARRMILLEVNEVPYRVWDDFCSRHPHSCLAQLMGHSCQYTSVSEDLGYEACRSHESILNEQGHLTPWITWPSVHRGVTSQDHKITDFGQELSQVDSVYPPIWQILAAHGVKTGIFGSLHTHPIPQSLDNYEFYVPDAFAKDSQTWPAFASHFQSFNLSMSRESPRNVSSGVAWKDALVMLLDSGRLGLKAHTYLDLARQLAHERSQPWVKGRRRTYQTVLAFDIFYKLLQKKKPAFATFFTNHLASAMHRYWAAAFPEDYRASTVPAEWGQTYSSEIDFAMRKLDESIGQLLRFIGQNQAYKLVVLSSMGQAATKATLADTELHIVDIQPLMTLLGIEASEWDNSPSMFPQYNVMILNPAKQTIFREHLQKLSICGDPISFREQDNGFFSLDFGQQDIAEEFAEYDGKCVHFSEIGLCNVANEGQSTKTADHVPEGSLFVYDPQSTEGDASRQQFSTTQIAPSILSNFSIPLHDYMNSEPIPALAA